MEAARDYPDDWQNYARCREITDPETFDEYFFPERQTSAVARLAIRICNGCEVRDSCLSDALEKGEYQSGIRGGMTPNERKRYAKQSSGDDDSPA